MQPLAGERLYLRPIQDWDLRELAQWLADPEVRRLVGPGFPRWARAWARLSPSPRDAQFAIVLRAGDRPIGICGLFGIVEPTYRTKPSFTPEITEVAREERVASGFIPDADRDDPVLDVAHKVRRYDPLGVSARSAVKPVTRCKIWDETAGTAEVGIVLGEKDCWGQGYGPEALALLLDHAFGDLALRQVSLCVHAANARAVRAYEKVGFIAEGRLRVGRWLFGRGVEVLMMRLPAATQPGSPVTGNRFVGAPR